MYPERHTRAAIPLPGARAAKNAQEFAWTRHAGHTFEEELIVGPPVRQPVHLYCCHAMLVLGDGHVVAIPRCDTEPRKAHPIADSRPHSACDHQNITSIPTFALPFWNIIMTRVSQRCVEGGQPRTWLLCALHTIAPGSSLGPGVNTCLAGLHNEAEHTPGGN